MRRIVLAALVAATFLFVSSRKAKAADGTSPNLLLPEPMRPKPYSFPDGIFDKNLFLEPIPHLSLGIKIQPFSELGPYIGLGKKHPARGIDNFTWSIWAPVSLSGPTGPFVTLKSSMTGFTITF